MMDLDHCDYDLANEVMDCCERRFKVRDITERRRHGYLVHARHVAVWVIRQMTDLSLPEIGRMFDVHHTTILNSIRQVEKIPKLFDRARVLQGLVTTQLERDKL
tara:strand:- start:407 stop:718 length:312 start_codon:yes stop_codon:yes gene_type:complete